MLASCAQRCAGGDWCSASVLPSVVACTVTPARYDQSVRSATASWRAGTLLPEVQLQPWLARALSQPKGCTPGGAASLLRARGPAPRTHPALPELVDAQSPSSAAAAAALVVCAGAGAGVLAILCPTAGPSPAQPLRWQRCSCSSTAGSRRCARTQKHKPTDHLWKMERIAKDMMAELRVGSYPDAGVTSLQECRCVASFQGLP